MILALFAASFSVGGQTAQPINPPPREFSSSVVGVSVFDSADGLLQMRSYHDSQLPEVVLKSGYGAPAGYQKEYTTIKTSFWPTSVHAIANGVMLVSGKSRRSGATVIEVWTLTPPTLCAASTPGSALTLVPGSIADINPVYSGDEPGKRLVRRAIPHRGVPGGAIIQFDDSRDVYALNTATAVMTPIASPDTTRATNMGCIHAPLLLETTGAAVAELVQGAYVYQFRVHDSPADVPSRLMFFDSDKNGSIDSVQTLSTNQWTAAGYADPSLWVKRPF